MDRETPFLPYYNLAVANAAHLTSFDHFQIYADTPANQGEGWGEPAWPWRQEHSEPLEPFALPLSIALQLPAPLCFPALRTVRLFTDPQPSEPVQAVWSLVNALSAAPNLENLTSDFSTSSPDACELFFNYLAQFVPRLKFLDCRLALDPSATSKVESFRNLVGLKALIVDMRPEHLPAREQVSSVVAEKTLSDWVSNLKKILPASVGLNIAIRAHRYQTAPTGLLPGFANWGSAAHYASLVLDAGMDPNFSIPGILLPPLARVLSSSSDDAWRTLCELLIARGADPFSLFVPRPGVTSSIYSSLFRSPEKVQYAFDQLLGSLPPCERPRFFRDSAGCTAAHHFATSSASMGGVLSFLSTVEGFSVDTPNIDGLSPLILACKINGGAPKIRAFKSAGANVEFQGPGGVTPLREVLENGSADDLNALMEGTKMQIPPSTFRTLCENPEMGTPVAKKLKFLVTFRQNSSDIDNLVPTLLSWSSVITMELVELIQLLLSSAKAENRLASFQDQILRFLVSHTACRLDLNPFHEYSHVSANSLCAWLVRHYLTDDAFSQAIQTKEHADMLLFAALAMFSHSAEDAFSGMRSDLQRLVGLLLLEKGASPTASMDPYLPAVEGGHYLATTVGMGTLFCSDPPTLRAILSAPDIETRRARVLLAIAALVESPRVSGCLFAKDLIKKQFETVFEEAKALGTSFTIPTEQLRFLIWKTPGWDGGAEFYYPSLLPYAKPSQFEEIVLPDPHGILSSKEASLLCKVVLTQVGPSPFESSVVALRLLLDAIPAEIWIKEISQRAQYNCVLRFLLDSSRRPSHVPEVTAVADLLPLVRRLIDLGTLGAYCHEDFGIRTNETAIWRQYQGKITPVSQLIELVEKNNLLSNSARADILVLLKEYVVGVKKQSKSSKK